MFYPEGYSQEVLNGDISCKVVEDEDRDMLSDSCRNEVHQKVTKSTLNSLRDPAGYEVIGAVERNRAQGQTWEDDVDKKFENKASNTNLTSHHPGMSLNYQPSVGHPVIPLTSPVSRVASSLHHPVSTAMPRLVSTARAAAMLAQRQQQAMMAHMIRQRYMGPVLLPGRLVPVQGSRPAVRVRVRWSRQMMTRY